MIEVRQALRLEGLQILLAAYDGSGGILGVSIQIMGTLLAGSPGCIVARTLFLQNHSPFLIDLHRIAGYEVRVIVHNQKTGIDHSLTHQRNIVQQVDGLLDAGHRVNVASERSTYALKPVKDSLSGEVLRAVEAHMLQEMCKTVLVRSLLKCSDVGSQIELGPVCGLVVVAYIIGHSIVQLSDLCLGVVWQCGQLLSEYQCGGAEQRRKSYNKFSKHSQMLKMFVLAVQRY